MSKMVINILEYLEQAQHKYAKKVIYKDEYEEITFEKLLDLAKCGGSFLTQYTNPRTPVVVMTDKSIRTPIIYYSVLYSGCFYVPIDVELPILRMKLILDTIQVEILVTDDKHVNIVEKLGFNGKIVFAKELEEATLNQHKLDKIRKQVMDIDPAYVIFTSGSTGTPKGVVESHRQLIDYIEAFSDAFDIKDDEVLGNQSPLDYVAALRDLYLPFKTGATTVFIPKKYFSAPVQLFEYLNVNKVTTICWVVGALTLCSEFGAFEECRLSYVRKVFFTGSVMPCKHLRVWQEHLPHAMYVNHYGPTEITASCTYYIVDHIVKDDEILPIGQPYRNTNILLINNQGEKAKQGQIGEIYVQGSSLALGYYKNPEKTCEAFVRNPLNAIYEEIIYKTGDLGRINDNGDLEFCGRKDFQIKHMGHRIELGEIEAVVQSIDEINEVVCLYNKEKQQIWLFFTGEIHDVKVIAKYLRKRLPNFMIPRKFCKLDYMPKSFNGKIDINKLKSKMQ